MKLFHTNNIDTVKECQMFFCFEMPSILFSRNVLKNFRNNTRITVITRILCVKL